jgi:hypothetical protein
MKKIILTVIAAAIGYCIAYPQPCLPEGIIFTTQEQIDSFQANYPGCTEIIGNVTILGDDINNLNGLSVLTSISCDFGIGDVTYPYSGGNPYLTSLTGLDNLASVWGNFLIQYNTALTNLIGLNNLTSIGQSFSINYNDTLTNLSALGNLTSIGGDLNIRNSWYFASLTGLENLTSIGGSLLIFYNDTLTNFTGLESLITINGSFDIEENYSLTNFTGLESLTTIGGNLLIHYNNFALTSLTGLESLTSIGLSLQIDNNHSLTSLAGIDNIQANSIAYLTIKNNVLLTECDVQSICDYLALSGAVVNISDNAPGCNSPEEVIDSCYITTIEEINLSSALQIIPNPSKDEITIQVPAFSGRSFLSIFTVSGKKLMERQIQEPETQIDISALPRGVYFLRLQNETMVEVGKLVKD